MRALDLYCGPLAGANVEVNVRKVRVSVMFSSNQLHARAKKSSLFELRLQKLRCLVQRRMVIRTALANCGTLEPRQQGLDAAPQGCRLQFLQAFHVQIAEPGLAPQRYMEVHIRDPLSSFKPHLALHSGFEIPLLTQKGEQLLA